MNVVVFLNDKRKQMERLLRFLFFQKDVLHPKTQTTADHPSIQKRLQLAFLLMESPEKVSYVRFILRTLSYVRISHFTFCTTATGGIEVGNQSNHVCVHTYSRTDVIRLAVEGIDPAEIYFENQEEFRERASE